MSIFTRIRARIRLLLRVPTWDKATPGVPSRDTFARSSALKRSLKRYTHLSICRVLWPPDIQPMGYLGERKLWDTFVHGKRRNVMSESDDDWLEKHKPVGFCGALDAGRRALSSRGGECLDRDARGAWASFGSRTRLARPGRGRGDDEGSHSAIVGVSRCGR